MCSGASVLTRDPGLESPDWYRAATLSERLASLTRHTRTGAGGAAESASRRLQRWSTEYPHLQDDGFSEYLAARLVSPEDFLHIVSEPIHAVRGRGVAPSSWLEDLRTAFDAPESSRPIPVDELSQGYNTVQFLWLVEPIMRQARDRLRLGLASLKQQAAAGLVIDERLEDSLHRNAARQLLQMIIPTCVLELNVARVQRSLTGVTREQRFQRFIARLRQRDAALALLSEYPTLARQVVICLDNWIAFNLEFLQHLIADWSELRARFCVGGDPGTLVTLDDGHGDRHQHGRSVLIATFSSGFRLVYKPRPLAVAWHFQELLTWLNDHGAEPRLRTIEVLDRGDYGWVEFVSQEGCQTRDDVRRFYARHGEYLALLYALEATDCHCENLIASGEHPMLVDLETLFQPSLSHADNGVTKAYRDSVLRIGLLPQRAFGSADHDGVDLSGIGAAAGQSLPYPVFQLDAQGTDEMRVVEQDGQTVRSGNQPTLDGTDVQVLEYVEAMTAGFATMYRVLLEHRDDLLAADGPLVRFASDTVRVVLRPTLTYGLLLRSSVHPDALRDALERDMLFGALCGDIQEFRYLAPIVPSEVGDLHRGDVPLFTTSIASRDVVTSDGESIPDFFRHSGMSRVDRRLRLFDEHDCVRQLWFIRASLATTAIGRESAAVFARPRHPGRVDATSVRLLAAAEAVGDRLDALALHSGDDVSWIGLTLTAKDHWSLVPLGIDFYNGLAGVAYFLAYLGQATRQTRFTALARQAANTACRRVSALPLHTSSLGAFDGLGGILFLLTHLGVIWDDAELLSEAEQLAERARALIVYDRKFDITGGSAGGILSFLALHRTTGSESAVAAAIECGDHLLEHARSSDAGVVWPPYFPATGPLSGLAHGVSGIAWALLELFGVTGQTRFRDAALEAFVYENSLFAPERQNWLDLRDLNGTGGRTFMAGWCHGAPGIALTRLQALRHVDNVTLRSDIATALETTVREGFQGDQSLCHGSLGNMEPLLQARDSFDQERWTGHVSRLSGEILHSIQDGGWTCGVPLGVESPGLMTGLAGIGYGLLRLAAPSTIPPVLTLAPPLRA
jgi:type 2 lantibiotic biosynthesis protein LanM